MESRRHPGSNLLAPPSEFQPEFRSHVTKGEDPDQLELLAHDYFAEFNPQGTLELFLVQTLVLAQWTKNRFERVETSLLRGAEDPVLVFLDAGAGRVMRQLELRFNAEQRRYDRALRDLRRLQSLRKAGLRRI